VVFRCFPALLPSSFLTIRFCNCGPYRHLIGIFSTRGPRSNTGFSGFRRLYLTLFSIHQYLYINYCAISPVIPALALLPCSSFDHRKRALYPLACFIVVPLSPHVLAPHTTFISSLHRICYHQGDTYYATTRTLPTSYECRCMYDCLPIKLPHYKIMEPHRNALPRSRRPTVPKAWSGTSN